MTPYHTASELGRALSVPVNRIIAAVESGTIAADGRAGSNKNAAFIFAASRLEEIKDALNGGKPATRPAPMPDIESVAHKAKALIRAKMEAAQ